MLTHVWRPSIGVRAEDSLRRYHGLLEPIDVAIPTQAPYNTSSAEGGLEPEPGSAAGEEGGDNSISFTQHEVQVVHGDGPSNVLYMHGLDAAQVADMSFQGVSGPPRLANRSDPIGTSRNPPAPATIADAEDTRCPTLDISADAASDRVGTEVAPNGPPVGRGERKRRDTDAGPQRAPR
eukprot:1717955-Pyramimonas_sp.AAC.1